MRVRYQIGNGMSRNLLPDRSLAGQVPGSMIAGMVTKIGSKQRPPHLYMAEWREASKLSVPQLANRLEVSRETVWRWENEQHRLNPGKIAAYADALGIEPEQLFGPPGRPSADALLKNVPQPVFDTAIDVVKRLVGSK